MLQILSRSVKVLRKLEAVLKIQKTSTWADGVCTFYKYKHFIYLGHSLCYNTMKVLKVRKRIRFKITGVFSRKTSAVSDIIKKFYPLLLMLTLIKSTLEKFITNTKVCLEPTQISTMGRFCQKS